MTKELERRNYLLLRGFVKGLRMLPMSVLEYITCLALGGGLIEVLFWVMHSKRRPPRNPHLIELHDILRDRGWYDKMHEFHEVKAEGGWKS